MNALASYDAEVVTADQIGELLERASVGETEALAELKEFLPACNDMLAQVYGDFSGRLEEALIDEHAGNDLLEGEGIRVRLAQLKGTLLTPQVTPVEAIVIERLTGAWLHAQRCDLAVSKNIADKQLRYRLHKLQADADRRLFRACRALAQLRKIISGSNTIERPETESVEAPMVR